MTPQQMMEEIDRLARLCEAKDAKLVKERELCTAYIERWDEAQAQIAMQAEKFQEIVDCPNENEGGEPWVIASEAISATSETVSAWRAKETEQLRREVAMLREASIEYRSSQDEHFDGDSCHTAKDIELSNASDRRLEEADGRLCTVLNDTQATALAYEREVKAKALEEVLESVSCKHWDCNTDARIRNMIAKLRAIKQPNRGSNE